MAARIFSATLETGDDATNAARAGEIAPAPRAAIKIGPRQLPRWKRKLVAGAFAGDLEVMTGAAPFSAVRKNATPASAMLRQQMRQLVAQGAIDFFGAEILQYGVHRDEGASQFRATYRGAHAGIPFDAQSRSKFPCAELGQEGNGAKP